MVNNLTKLCQLIRYDIITSTTAAGSGHPTSSLSATELMSALFFGGFLHYDLKNPKYVLNDRVIFSKGHASPLLYALYQAAGVLKHEELLNLRKFDSVLEGHPTPRFKYIDVSTGSLGQGLSTGIGMALGIKLKIKSAKLKITREPKVFVLLGDSEFAEGQVWEAMEIASHYNLNNLVAVLDVNRLGQRGETMLGWDMKTYEKRVSSFGWNTIVLKNGHDIKSIVKAYKTASKSKNKPTMIIAKTKKGKGVSFLENKDDWHGKAVPKDMLEKALKEIGKVNINLRGEISKPQIVRSSEFRVRSKNINELQTANYEQGTMVATREAYGHALVSLGKQNPNLVVLDAETSNSTYADKFKKEFPERYFEMYIAEQNMTSVAVGLSKLGFVPFISSFAAFLSRAFDQIRMAQYSEANTKIVGSHAGVSIGFDGASQMALEDISMMRSILESTVFYPSDAVSTHYLTQQAMDIPGIVYLRTTREKTPVLYKQNETFSAGGSKILKQSATDIAVVFTAGITLVEAVKAYEELKKEGINIAVVDLYSIKPVDKKTVNKLAAKTGNVIVVEDHYPMGGIGEAVLSSIQHPTSKINFIHLAVSKIPRSGSPEELLGFEEIDSKAIVKKVKEIAKAKLELQSEENKTATLTPELYKVVD